MNRLITSTIIAISLFISNAGMADHGKGGGGSGGGGGGQQAQMGNMAAGITVDTSITLTDAEETNLAFMREEEKLARDVYLHFYDLLGTKIFTNIANAEQTHMDSVKLIIDAYSLTDPAPVDRGFFTDPDLQDLYDQLTTAENDTLIEALNVGALIEEVDIKDLYHSISETNNPAILQVYTQLLNGSYKHLNAFVKQLDAQGVSYSAQLLSAENVDSILSGETFNAEIVTGQAIDSDANITSTQSRFNHSISSDSTIMPNGAELDESAQLILSSHFLPEAEDIGEVIEYIALLRFQVSDEQDLWFFRSGEQWTPWNGDLTSAGQQTLSAVQSFNIFQGQLSNLQGDFTIYVGYRLENGKIVYSVEPISFSIQ